MDATTDPQAASRSAAPPLVEVHAPGSHARGVDPLSGPLLFARYAFGPNRLGLCGPEDWRSMLELGSAAAAAGGANDGSAALTVEIDRGLRHLAAGFEGAFPYLRLIADAHGIDDALDRRVVDAYWIGNSLSDAVDPELMTRSMDDRFRRQLGAKAWRWLEGKPASGARPTHAFHVFDVFPRVGLARGSDVTDSAALMESCRIRWGRVVEVSGGQLVVDVIPLQMQEGKLVLGEAQPQAVRRWLDGTGFVSDVEPGDTVSVHWDWACEVLSGLRLRALQGRTRHSLEIANQTI